MFSNINKNTKQNLYCCSDLLAIKTRCFHLSFFSTTPCIDICTKKGSVDKRCSYINMLEYTITDIAVHTCCSIIYIPVKLGVNCVYKFVHTLQLLYKMQSYVCNYLSKHKQIILSIKQKHLMFTYKLFFHPLQYAETAINNKISCSEFREGYFGDTTQEWVCRHAS